MDWSSICPICARKVVLFVVFVSLFVFFPLLNQRRLKLSARWFMRWQWWLTIDYTHLACTHRRHRRRTKSTRKPTQKKIINRRTKPTRTTENKRERERERETERKWRGGNTCTTKSLLHFVLFFGQQNDQIKGVGWGGEEKCTTDEWWKRRRQPIAVTSSMANHRARNCTPRHPPPSASQIVNMHSTIQEHH